MFHEHGIYGEEVMVKILMHLCLWEVKVRLPPKVKAPSVTISIDDSDSRVPFSTLPFYPDPEYPVDSNRVSRPRWVTAMVTVSARGGLFQTPQTYDVKIGYPHFPVIVGDLGLTGYPHF